MVRDLGSIDVSALVPMLADIAWPLGSFRHGIQESAMIDIWPLPIPAEPIIDEILGRHFTGRTRGMTVLSRVVPGQVIAAHQDTHDGGCRERVHVPLTTNEHAYFCTGGQDLHMAVGRIYVIDPTQEHCVVNHGTTDRIHLIFNAKEGGATA